MSEQSINHAPIDLTLSKISEVIVAWDIENADLRVYDRSKHVLLHLLKAAGKAASYLEELDHGVNHPIIINEEVVPDMIILALQWMKENEIDPQASLLARLRSLEVRNNTPGSTDRALALIDYDDSDYEEISGTNNA